MISRERNFYRGPVTVAAARIVESAARSRDTRTTIAGFRVAAMIAHGVLTGIALRAEKAAARYADATVDISRIGAAPRFPEIRCVGCEEE